MSLMLLLAPRRRSGALQKQRTPSGEVFFASRRERRGKKNGEVKETKNQVTASFRRRLTKTEKD